MTETVDTIVDITGNHISVSYAYGTYKNGDMNEGRGPMILDSLFDDIEEAKRYVSTRTGVMGARGSINGWEIRKHVVYECAEDRIDAVDADVVERALDKLSDHEQDLLSRYFQQKSIG